MHDSSDAPDLESPPLIARLSRLAAEGLRSPSVHVAILFALIGVGFAGGNLVLARALSPADYGLVALWLAIYFLGGALAPWGAEGVVNRRRIRADWRLLRRVLVTSLGTALVVVTVAGAVYPFSPPELLLLFAGIVAAGLAVVAAAQFQARERFFVGMAIWQGQNVVLLLGALLALVIASAGTMLPISVVAGATGVFAVAGWRALRGIDGDGSDREPYRWREAFAYFLASSTSAFLPQVERLVIPRVLSLEDLALFGVLASLVIAPYRMLQLGVGYTLFPRLSKAGSPRERRKMFVAEVRMAVAGAILAGLLVWYMAPWITHGFLGDKYDLEAALVLAGIAAGAQKLLGALGRALVFALGTPADITRYGAASWFSLVCAAAGAWFGSSWGVAGVIYGTTAGLMVRTLFSLFVGLRYLARDDTERKTPGVKGAGAP